MAFTDTEQEKSEKRRKKSKKKGAMYAPHVFSLRYDGKYLFYHCYVFHSE
jgi:hypothetical protein